jgi:hypothetical protein
LNSFFNELKTSASQKEITVLDFVMKDSLPQYIKQESKENSDIEKFDLMTKNFENIKEILQNFRVMNERECRLRINKFIIDFEQNMQVLMSLTNLFEQKTTFEIEKQRNVIIEILNSSGINPKIKLQLLNEKIEEMTQMIKQTFENIKEKISNYEGISDKKILRAKNSFLINLKKFLK